MIFDHADLDSTVEQVAFAAFYNAGQHCTAASRVLAHEAVYDEVVQRLAEAARTTPIGPLISGAQRDRVLALLAGTPAHAKIVVGGGIPDRDLDFGAVSVNAHAPMSSELPHGGFGSPG